jgi:hypothetical protein
MLACTLLKTCRVGGEGGIRTLDTLLAYTHFPGVLFRPLRHLSVILFIMLQVVAIIIKAIVAMQRPLNLKRKGKNITLTGNKKAALITEPLKRKL